MGITTAVRERSGPLEAGAAQRRILTFRHRRKKPAMLVQKENEIHRNKTAKPVMTAICKEVICGAGNVRAKDQLATAVCSKTKIARVIRRRHAVRSQDWRRGLADR